MCGIVGIVGNQNVAGQLYYGLTVLQHRGQAVSYTHLDVYKRQP